MKLATWAARLEKASILTDAMHRATRWAIVAIALTVWVSGVVTPIVAQQEPSPTQLRLDLDRLHAQINALQARLTKIGERRDNLVEEFEAADVRLALSRRQLESVQLRLLVLSQEAQELNGEVARLTGEMAKAQKGLSARVVALYRMGPLSYSRFLLTAGNSDELLANYQLVRWLASQNQLLVKSIRTQITEQQEAVRAANETTVQLTTMRAEETLALQDLIAQQELRQELIKQIDTEALVGRRSLEEQAESAAVLEELLGTVLSKPVIAPLAGEQPAFTALLGDLSWPTDGQITEKFGRKQHAVYNTYTLVKGIKIAAGVGAPVHTVYRGRIVFADWFQNYGLMVVVSHGDDFYTIYGHLDTILVRMNEWVDDRHQIGTVGQTGSLIGPSLHFEIRDGTEAVNPELWLREQ
ncbi:MAG: peptidoglycan DD-metalloendopeptidase family protein [Acidobacteriota bacterium]|nr:peptidoglycan DD-metalloendopeptidase family protein [Acidobacteriota bacterium]